MEQIIKVNGSDIEIIKRDLELIKDMLLVKKGLSAETFGDELEAWNRASEEDYLSFEKTL